MKVLISGGAGQISYSLLPMIANGSVFGTNKSIELILFDIPPALNALHGVKMELEDSCYTLLKDVIITDDPKVAFNDIDVAILLGGFPRREGMDRNDLINKNTSIFKSNGENLNLYAKSSCKVLVVANPANTNCLVTMKNCPKLNKKNFTCLTMLDHNRATAFLSNKFSKPLNNVIIWGNHSKTQYPDHNNVGINLTEEEKHEFIRTIQYRGDKIIKLRKLSSAMSAAKAIADHLRIWLIDGTPDGQFVSMGIYSEGHYGVEKDIIFSFPCVCTNGEYQIVENLNLDEDVLKGIKLSQEELLLEKKLTEL